MATRKRFSANEAAARLQQLLADSSCESDDESCSEEDDIDNPTYSDANGIDNAGGDHTDDDTDDSDDSSAAFEPNVTLETEYKAPSGRIWKSVPPAASRTRSANIFSATQGPLYS